MLWNVFGGECGERHGEGLERAQGIAKVEGESSGAELAELEHSLVGRLTMALVVECLLGVDEKVLRGRGLDALATEVKAEAA